MNAACALLAQHAPALWVSLASDVCPEIREYERLSTVSANAYVQPLVAGYLRRLQQGLKKRGLHSEPFLMTSGGALTTLQSGIDEPVRLVESGPAGGAVLARQVAEQIGAARALSFDMGGTTAKMMLHLYSRPRPIRYKAPGQPMRPVAA